MADLTADAIITPCWRCLNNRRRRLARKAPFSASILARKPLALRSATRRGKWRRRWRPSAAKNLPPTRSASPASPRGAMWWGSSSACPLIWMVRKARAPRRPAPLPAIWRASCPCQLCSGMSACRPPPWSANSSPSTPAAPGGRKRSTKNGGGVYTAGRY